MNSYYFGAKYIKMKRFWKKKSYKKIQKSVKSLKEYFRLIEKSNDICVGSGNYPKNQSIFYFIVLENEFPFFFQKTFF